MAAANSFRYVSMALMMVSIPAVSRAEIFKCHFTEPFVVTTYSTNQSTLTIEEASQPAQVVKDISFQIVAPNVFELWGVDKRPVQRLELTNAGSDGMSDDRYPYYVRWMPKGLRGGCTSNHLPVRKPAAR